MHGDTIHAASLQETKAFIENMKKSVEGIHAGYTKIAGTITAPQGSMPLISEIELACACPDDLLRMWSVCLEWYEYLLKRKEDIRAETAVVDVEYDKLSTIYKSGYTLKHNTQKEEELKRDTRLFPLTLKRTELSTHGSEISFMINRITAVIGYIKMRVDMEKVTLLKMDR